MSKPRISVVGSSNVDLVTYAPRLPQLGETVSGTEFQIGFGGKGANQAVMAAKLGADVLMITRIGDDIFGQDYARYYESLGLDMRHVLVTENTSNGVAPIWVDGNTGNNSIIVVPGANGLLSPDDVAAAADDIAATSALICQWEVPLETTLAALRTARTAGVTTIYNPAPARPDLPTEAYELSDIFCINESETALLTDLPVESTAECEAAAHVLLERGARNVVLTLGERGSLLVNGDGATHISATPVQAVDTTGAGDAFVGSLAYFLTQKRTLPDAMARAGQIAAVSVQSPGAQGSFPYRADLPDSLFGFTI